VRSFSILIAPDKFKGTLTALEAARAIRDGVRKARPDWQCTLLPLSDGGEGFVEALVRGSGGTMRSAKTIDPLGHPCVARWGVLGDGKTAVVGLAEASSLAGVPKNRRHPGRCSNVGTGLILRHILKKGFRTVIVGLGGSATTDGGIGLLSPLGFQFLDKEGQSIPLTGDGLARLERIVPPKKIPRACWIVATDVASPLFGAKGASFQFGPQKGGTRAVNAALDHNLRRLARIAQRDLGCSRHQVPGAGAAGGCGYGLMTFLHAAPRSGFALVSEFLDLEKRIRAHDLIITGEGCLDRTSLAGKAPVQLARLARRLNKPVWALCGQVRIAVMKLPFAVVGETMKHSIREPKTTADAARQLKNLVIATLSSRLSF